MAGTGKNFDYYIGINRVPTNSNVAQFQRAETFVSFPLVAFCDDKNNPQWACKGQIFSNPHFTHLANEVNGTNYNNEDFSLSQELVADAVTKLEENIKEKWFIFFDIKMDNGFPYCRTKAPFSKPEKAKDWTDAVAVPVFSSVTDAEDDWFKNEERAARSKLALVGDDENRVVYYSNKNLFFKEQDIQDDICSLGVDDFPFVVMKREQYDALCQSDQSSTSRTPEANFIDHFEKTCQDNGLNFSKETLWNFHTSVKSGYLTILEGISGNGKSSLPRMYQKAFGDNCKLCMLPVSPAWTDDSELLGYWDPQKSIYVHTELLDFLIDAQEDENQDCLYLVCLDEMNLARVEHYFYRFLSVMEAPKEERWLLLHGKGKKADCKSATGGDNGKEKKTDCKPATGGDNGKEKEDDCMSVKIQDNVRFLGSINTDDTTFAFADKVRDRANIISLEVESYQNHSLKIKKEDLHAAQGEEPKDSQPETGKYCFRSFVKSYEDLPDSQEESLRIFLWQLHKTLANDGRPFGVSPRTVRAIGAYLANAPQNVGDSLNMEALDLQVSQRILTKLHGTPELLGKLVGEDGAISKTLKTQMPTGKWNACLKALQEKEEELNIYGYCH